MIVESDNRRGVFSTSTIHPQTIEKVLKETNASTVKGQKTTKARARGRKDIRDMMSMAAKNEASARNKPPQMFGNFDATQYIISGKCEEPVITLKHKEEDNLLYAQDENPVTTVEETQLSQAVKWVMLCDANGNLATDVFLLNDSDMDPNDFKCYQVPGLTHTTIPGAFGYLCFTKIRYGNTNFFSWYITNVVAEFVNQCRSLLPSDRMDTDFYCVADGEELQIEPTANDDVIKILNDCHIHMGKGPASCTDTIGNACDRSNLFKASKKS